jgi:phosphate transport system permease protein
MTITTTKPNSHKPWDATDSMYRNQQLLVHVGTPLLAALVVSLTGIRGGSGLFFTWLGLHLITGALLAKFGRRKYSIANSSLQVLLVASLILFVTAAMSVLLPVFVKGIAAFSSNLLFQDAAAVEPGSDLTSGGILHAIIGTTVIVIFASIISIPLGILAALYVTEVRGRLTPYVRFFVQAMSGVPSIVAGLFVYAALIVTGILPFSGLSGAIALSILMLPTVARTAEEVLLLVPDDLRSAALALGATQRKVVRMVVLPSAGAGLVTASILGVARITGETAPLLLTAFGSTAINTNPFNEPMSALPIYIFTQMLLGTENDVARAWFACMVLMIMVGLLFGTARFLVSRKKLK